MTYEGGEVDDLRLAYAMSVHKAQGSEYAVVIMPLVPGHYIMLQRNLFLYGHYKGQKTGLSCRQQESDADGRHERPDAQALFPSCRTAAWGTWY